jgi:hypothetical protein
MTDLTAITTPFGLLDDATREALKSHGGPIQVWDHVNGFSDVSPAWWPADVYRVKPQPPKPREWWIVGESEAWDRKSQAEFYAPLGSRIIHVREVIE